MHNIGPQELAAILVVFAICGGWLVIPFWNMFAKAGYPGVWSLAMLVPLVNVAMLCFLAFSEWPVLKELKALRQGTMPSGPPHTTQP